MYICYTCIHVCIHQPILIVKIDNTYRPRRRHRHKCTKYKKCLAGMVSICMKQHLSNILGSCH